MRMLTLGRHRTSGPGRGNRHQRSPTKLVDPADDRHHHGAEEPCGAAERPVAALPGFLVDRRGDGSVVVCRVVTVAAENSLPATPVDLFPGRAW